MEQIASFEANKFCAPREIPRLLWNSKVYILFKCTPSKISFTCVAIPAYSFTAYFGYWLSHYEEDVPVCVEKYLL